MKMKQKPSFIMILRSFAVCVKNAAVTFVRHDGIEQAGYLAFLLLLGIFPLMIFLVSFIHAINAYYFTPDLYHAFEDLVTQNNWSDLVIALKPRIVEITHSPPNKLLTFAIFGVIWTASSVFEGLRTALNRAYRVERIPNYFLARLLSIIKFVAMSFIIGAFVAVFSLLPYISNLITHYLHLDESSFRLWFKILSGNNEYYLHILVISILLYLHYAIPNAKQRLKKTVPGVLFTVIGWYVCSIVLQYYLLSFSQLNFVYGSITGVVISLLYFYFCSIIFIYGAELNYHIYNASKVIAAA